MSQKLRLNFHPGIKIAIIFSSMCFIIIKFMNSERLYTSLTPMVENQCQLYGISHLNLPDLSLDRKQLQAQDVFVAVRSTEKFWWRLKVIHDTWHSFSTPQTYIFIDQTSKIISKMFGDHIIVTKCGDKHDRDGLSCKLHYEMRYYLAKSKSRWFCHFDDDIYLNAPKLIKMLNCFDFKKDLLLGRHIFNKSHHIPVMDMNYKYKVRYGFPVGSAYCFTKSVIQKLIALIGNRTLTEINRNLNDDIMIGYLTEYILGVQLTDVETMYHQYLPDGSLTLEQLKRLITFPSGVMNSSTARAKRFFEAHKFLSENELDMLEHKSRFMNTL